MHLLRNSSDVLPPQVAHLFASEYLSLPHLTLAAAVTLKILKYIRLRQENKK